MGVREVLCEDFRVFNRVAEYYDPIETLEDVLDSEFSIGYMPSGTIVRFFSLQPHNHKQIIYLFMFDAGGQNV